MPESPIKHPFRPRSAAARPQNNQKKEPPRHQRQNFHVYRGTLPPPGGAPAAACCAEEEGEIRAFLNHTGLYRAHPRRLLEELAASQRPRMAGRSVQGAAEGRRAGGEGSLGGEAAAAAAKEKKEKNKKKNKKEEKEGEKSTRRRTTTSRSSSKQEQEQETQENEKKRQYHKPSLFTLMAFAYTVLEYSCALTMATIVHGVHLTPEIRPKALVKSLLRPAT